MNQIEKIKFGDQIFDLVPAGVNLGDNGGTIIFQKGASSFDAIETVLKANGAIAQIGLSREQDWSRADLVYAGRLAKQSDYVIGVAEDGVTDIKADVMIATFRTPDLTDRVAALEAENAEIKKDNAAMKESLGTLILNNLEEV